ncbi:MAG: hypothetical protein IPK74_04955 [Deltaproteobacteria bacterium]|nr:hypothetical protein [Deltaproteobacteria bacterium]
MVVQGRRVALRSGCVVAWLSACAGTGLDGGTDGSSSETGGTADSSGGAGTVATTRGGETTVGSVDGSGDSSGAGASSESSTGAAASSEGTTGEPFPEPVPDDCITDVTAGHHAFVCDGLTYDVEVPAACLLAPCGMIVDVHGLAMSAQMQDSNTNMRALGQRYGYIVVQPNADPAPPLSNWIPGIDDPKVFDFMQRTAAAWHVDADRWHFTGFSQGGFMTWRFACAHADVLASVAPGAACGNDFPIEDCQFTDDESPSEPLDILYLHGTQDFVVNYGCALPRVEAVRAHFGLDGEPEVVLDDPDVRWQRFAGDTMTFEYLEHDYIGDNPIAGGHCMPGADDPGDAPGELVGASCDDPNLVVWGEAVVQFFLAHPKGA